MKNIILGIIIGILFSIGSIALAQTKVRLIMVPEQINGYYTTDLLNYVSTLKARQDAIDNSQQYSKEKIERINNKTTRGA